MLRVLRTRLGEVQRGHLQVRACLESPLRKAVQRRIAERPPPVRRQRLCVPTGVRNAWSALRQLVQSSGADGVGLTKSGPTAQPAIARASRHTAKRDG